MGWHLRADEEVSALDSIRQDAAGRILYSEGPDRYHATVPTILRERGYRFFFYMADRFEPPHVHVAHGDRAAKLWLDPLRFASVEGFRRHECNDILRIAESHLDEFLQAWYRSFGDLSHE